jgi:hypothetical protein
MSNLSDREQQFAAGLAVGVVSLWLCGLGADAIAPGMLSSANPPSGLLNWLGWCVVGVALVAASLGAWTAAARRSSRVRGGVALVGGLLGVLVGVAWYSVGRYTATGLAPGASAWPWTAGCVAATIALLAAQYYC